MKKVIIFILLLVNIWACSGSAEPEHKQHVVKSNLRLRNKPGLKGTVILLLKKGEQVSELERLSPPVVIDGKRSFWLKIQNQAGKVGYVFGGYLAPVGKDGVSPGYVTAPGEEEKEVKLKLEGREIRIVKTLSEGAKVAKGVVNLNNSDPGAIEQHMFVEDQSFLYLAYTLNFGEGVMGYLAKIERESLKTVWTSGIPGFNLSEPLVEGDFAYVSAIGFIGKVDLKSGNYIWKHSGLYQKGNFNSFAKIQLQEPDQVEFLESEKQNGERKKISAHRETGEFKILEL